MDPLKAYSVPELLTLSVEQLQNIDKEAAAKRYADRLAGGGEPIRDLSQARQDRIREVMATVRSGWQSEAWWSRKHIEEFLASEEGVAKCDPRLLELHRKLLSFGGAETCLPIKEPDLHDILDYGQLWLGDRALLRKGRDNQCHGNSCAFYMRGRDKRELTIATGYALSQDGIWRQHSWLLWKRPRTVTVIETTVRRVLYFGFAMTEKQAEKFCEECLW